MKFIFDEMIVWMKNILNANVFTFRGIINGSTAPQVMANQLLRNPSIFRGMQIFQCLSGGVLFC